jgi:hypothetical protein
MKYHHSFHIKNSNMVRKARIRRTKAVFKRNRKTDVPHIEADPASHNHATPSIPVALQTVLRKPLQTSHAKSSHRNRQTSRKHQQAISQLSSLIQQRIIGYHSWTENKIHPIALLAWLAAEEPINSDFLIENTALLAESSTEDIDPIFATQLDDVIVHFLDAGITDHPSLQENPLVDVPKDFSMFMTPYAIAGQQDHDALMTGCDMQMNAFHQSMGVTDPRKSSRHGFDPVHVLKKHAITLKKPVSFPHSTLTSDIHMLFREESFHGCPQHMYEVLKPGLRLASLILTHHATSVFWHTLIFGHRQSVIKGRSLYNSI